MSIIIDAGRFQQLSGCNNVVCMSDLVAALRLVNDNIKYLSDFPDDQISVDMKNHLIEDREIILQQAQYNINSRKKPDNVEQKKD